MKEILNVKESLKNYATTTVCIVTLRDAETGLQLLSTTLQDCNIDFKEDNKEIRGGQGNPVLFSWNTNRQIKIKVTDAVSKLDWTAAKLGQKIKEGTIEVFKDAKMYTVASGGVVTLDVKPKYPEDVKIFDGVSGELLDKQNYTISENVVTIKPEAKVPDGGKVYVYGYKIECNDATYIDIESDKFAKTFETILTYPLVEKSGNTIKTTKIKQYIFPMGQLSGAFSEDAGADSKGSKYVHEIKILNPDGNAPMGRLAVFPMSALNSGDLKNMGFKVPGEEKK